MRDKREHQRATLEVDVQVAVPGVVSWTAQSVDISLGGMFLLGESQAVIGTEITLTFELPKLGRVTMPGFVRWSSARGFGVQFGLMGPRETHAIGGLVRKQPALEV